VAVTRAILAEEGSAAAAWTTRHKGWAMDLDVDGMRLEARTTHPADGDPLLVVATFDGYRAVPPTWRFVDPVTGETTPHSFPLPGPVGSESSIFHGSMVICAQWSRLAYGEHNGPHGNWGPETGWLNVREGNHAENVSEMLAVLHVHLTASPGRMG
jgi:hypothetical protein